jgi:molybdate/tungstate transport system ATP-binding protein
VIKVAQLGIRVGAFALSGLNFEVADGQYAVLMGKTGSGKTTLLEALCGLKPVMGGAIFLQGREVTGLPPAARNLGYVPQDRALFQTMTVREHLAFGPTIRKWPRREIEPRVGELAKLLGLERLLGRRPAGLSGGEAQRVALGRALAARPGILCLDEPLSALDDDTREEMYALLRIVRQQTGVTTLHVTHHLAEAQRLADLILILKDGRIEQTTGGQGTRPDSPQRNPARTRASS